MIYPVGYDICLADDIRFAYVETDIISHLQSKYIISHMRYIINQRVILCQKTTNADELKKYKDLLDSGAISQEEFEAKKKELLGL
ncbi:MAG: SHOCT domain-containing protein [Clostridia bacterium]|nr:SHOCT domain-containing protein [Clostridia bacterium]